MSARIVALPAIAMAALILLGGIVAIAMLLPRHKNWAVGIVLFLIGLPVVVIFGSGVLHAVLSHRVPRETTWVMPHDGTVTMPHVQRARFVPDVPGRSYVVAEPATRRAAARLQGVRESIRSIKAAAEEVQAAKESTDRITHAAPVQAAEEADAPSGAQSQTEPAPPAESHSLLRAIGRALGTGIAETKEKQEVELAAEHLAVETAPAPADQQQPAADQPPEPAENDPPPTANNPPLADKNSPPSNEDSPPAETAKPAAAERPAWIDSEPGTVDGVYQVVVKVGPYNTSLECDANQGYAIWDTMRQYVTSYLGSQAARQVRLTPEILRHIVRGRWQETNEYSVGPMIERYLLLKFDDAARGMIKAERDRTIVAGRLWYTGGGVAVVLALLSVLFAGLKIDGATDGAYRSRLFLAGIAVMVPVLSLIHI